MIVKSFEADRYIARAPGDLAAALVFGPDQGLVRERAEALAKSVVSDLKDPFRVADLDEAALAADNARLFDEAAAMSMTGGRRIVRVRAAGNAVAKLFEAFLGDPKGDALIVVEAGDLPKGSSLRRTFESAGNAAAIQCYADSAQGLAEVLRRALKTDEITIGAEALDDAIARLGSDRGVARRQIEKLALYVGPGNRAELGDVRAILGDETEGRVEEVCDAMGEGDVARLDAALERLWSEGASAVAILWIAILHFQRVLAAQTLSARQNVETIIRTMRPPVHFTRVASFKGQVFRWHPDKLLQALSVLLETEVLCKSTAIPAEAACARALYRVAAMARLGPG
jgi:DNA polymerase-3 subunit delta